MTDEPVDPIFGGIEVVVEATDYERSVLWSLYSRQAVETRVAMFNQFGKDCERFRLDWGDTSTRMVHLGKLKKRPVVMIVTVQTINGRKVGFWHMSSEVADHRRAERWFDEVCPGVDRTDAQNFPAYELTEELCPNP